MKALGRMRWGWAITGILLAATAAMAQGPGGERPGGEMGVGPGFGNHPPPFERTLGPEGDHGRWWNNPKIVAELKLTSEQRKAFEGILMAHRENLIDLRASLEKAELAMEPLMGDDQPNETAILSQIDKVAQARAELEKANARFLLAIRAKLTLEQWKQMQADRVNHRQEINGWRKRGQGANKQGPGGGKQGGQHHRLAPPPPPQGAGAPAPDEQ